MVFSDLIDLRHRPLDALGPEVRRGGHHQGEIRGGERFARQSTQGRRAVDEHQVVPVQMAKGPGQFGSPGSSGPGVETNGVRMTGENIDLSRRDFPVARGQGAFNGFAGGVSQDIGHGGSCLVGLQQGGGVSLGVEVNDECRQPANGGGAG